LPVPIEESIEFVRAAKAQAAIFYYYAEEEALTWDYPAQRRALDRAGIPSLCLREQPYPVSEALEDTLRDFMAGVAERPQLRRPQRVKVGAS
jgi:hypothetical protein